MKNSMEHCWNYTDRGKLKLSRKTSCHSTTVSTTQNGAGSKQSLRGERPAINSLRTARDFKDQD